MAGLEVVVRPVVFPNIRPAPARALAPEDNPDQGFAVINGTGGKMLDLPHSWSVSVTKRNQQQETKRQYDTEKVYQVNDNGTINKKNFVEVERLKKVRLDAGDDQGALKVIYAQPPTLDNVETTGTDLTRETFIP
jgi:hypothetical protein